MKPYVVSILIVLSAYLSTEAQDVKVTASFDTSKIYIGDQIDFTISVEQPSDLHLNLPLFKDTLSENIEIISGPIYDTVQLPENRLKIREKYLITSFDSGFYRLPPLYAEFKNEKGLKRFYSDYSQLEVMRIKIAPPDTTAKIFDIIKPYNAAITLGEILPWILLAAVAGAAIWLFIKLYRKLKKDKTIPGPVINPDPAHVIALRELDKLGKEMLWQKGEIKKYYTRLTEILRQYLENRFGVFSLELTTSETLAELVKTGFKKDESYNLLKTVLTVADLVKFARYRPLEDENDLYFEDSYKFVRNTKIIEETLDKVGSNNKEEEGGV